jgi:PPP family 3-phenylpropionic acid transporter
MNCGMFTLSAFYAVYFIGLGFLTFASKYFAQIGLSGSQIALLTSVPALVAMCFMPMWGALSDRVRLKKAIVAVMLALSSVVLFFVDVVTDFSKADPITGTLPSVATKFAPLLIILIISAFFSQAANPTATSIALEYTNERGASFGPIRMMGTIGYLIGVFMIGRICKNSLRHIYTYFAIASLAGAAVALTLPNVRGHQFGGIKISPVKALRDKRIVALLVLVLVGTCSTMFYQSFFGAYLEEMGVNNQITSVITAVSVILEIFVLLYAVQIMRHLSIWKWMIFGYVLNGIRWLGFVLAYDLGSWQLLLVAQIPAVTAMACFEFFPTLYIGKIIAPELSSSAQTLLTFTSFGVAKVLGGLLGGFISDLVGMRSIFLFFGILLLVAGAAAYPICRKLTRAERAAA